MPRATLAGFVQVGHHKPMSLLQNLFTAFKPAIDLIYPPRCPLCGDAIAEQKGLCSQCWPKLVIPGEPACATCYRPFQQDIGNGPAQCAPCMDNLPLHDGIAAATLYNDASRKLILAFKHGRRIALAKMLAKQMAGHLPTLEEGWLIIPVPLHRSRLWYRGFNQSALLAREIAKLTNQTLIVDGLVRTEKTAALGGLGRKAREQALSGAIAVARNREDQIANSNIILVDDVLTSGATSDACVRAMKKAKAKRVKISCYSRVLDEIVTP